MQTGAIVLCGGKSNRMGRDKATLPFGPETMLQRVIRLLSQIVPVENLVVVAAKGQVLPPLPTGACVARDKRPERGPLEGLAAGLRALPSEIDAVYVTSCDVPLLAPAFVKQMLAAIGDHDIALPRDGEYRHPLAAVYRPAVLGAVERLLAADCLRLQSLLHESRTREVPVSQLRRVDPQLGTLWNLNEPQDYEAALRAAGLTA